MSEKLIIRPLSFDDIEISQSTSRIIHIVQNNSKASKGRDMVMIHPEDIPEFCSSVNKFSIADDRDELKLLLYRNVDRDVSLDDVVDELLANFIIIKKPTQS